MWEKLLSKYIAHKKNTLKNIFVVYIIKDKDVYYCSYHYQYYIEILTRLIRIN